MATNCNICGEERAHELPGFLKLPRVSSDCKPVGDGGALVVCNSCGSMSKPVNELFLKEIAAIYDSYDVYYQGGGMEQMVHDRRSGKPMRRSSLLMQRFLDSALLGREGRVIDIGCGNGKFLSAYAQTYENWQLFGMELDRRHEKALQEIPQFDRLISGDIKELDQRFDLITMVHALEHFLDPFDTLVSLRANLSKEGLLFIQVPNVAENPFDLLIADHVSHLTPGSLSAMLVRAGYEVVRLQTDWVAKELSVFARPARGDEMAGGAPFAAEAEMTKGHVAWLEAVLSSAKDCASAGSGPFGVFGTSIAATWLASAMGGEIEFFLDDDVSRQGTLFFDKPVLAPEDAPLNSRVFIGLAPVVASIIAKRMKTMGHEAFIPPDISTN